MQHPRFQKLMAIASAALLTAMLLPLHASAATEQILVGYYGDVNLDGTVTAVDAALLSRHLVGIESITDSEAALRSDLDHNGMLNAMDLSLLKQGILNGLTFEGIYEEIEVPDPELIDAPVKAIHPAVPSIGEPRILLVTVNFPDCAFNEGYSTQQVHDLVFGPDQPDSRFYPMETISGYYQRASYGRLHLQGEVYTYTVSRSIHSYVGNADSLVDEVLAGLDAQIDYTRFDANQNHAMDTLLLALPGSASTDDWWPCSGGYYGGKYFDGVTLDNLCIGGWALSDVEGFNSTWIHELGHAMGLPDYYKYENTENGYYGLNGDAGLEMMDDAFGDMSAFSKLMLGWYQTDEVMVYQGGTQTYQLRSSQQAPNCIVIPRGDLNGYLSEYFVVEFATYESNNINWQFRGGGIRVLHCQAEVTEGWWGPEFKYNNYGMHYDSSNQKQRVLRLVNEGNGFFGQGAVINNAVNGFAWYDANGYQTVNPGITITVGALADGAYTVTITQ